MKIHKQKYLLRYMVSILIIALLFTGNGYIAGAENSSNSSNNGSQNNYASNSPEKLLIVKDSKGKEIDLKQLDKNDYNGYIFKLKDDTSDSYISAKDAAKTKGQIDKMDVPGFFTAKSLQAISDYINTDYVEYIEPNYTVKITSDISQKTNTATPNDPQYSTNQWNLPMMNVEGAWEEKVYGEPIEKKLKEDVKVAVIDSGLYGTGSQAASPHEDIAYEKVSGGVNLIDSYKGTPDMLGHGTFVSGLINASTNNGKGIAGIMPEVKIIPIKVFGTADTTSNSTVIEGVYQSMDAGADVINMSLGSEYNSSALETACNDAVDNGILVVASAGNDGTSVNNYPAAYDSVVGVASLDSDGTPSYFSQYGKSVYVAAPGGAVRSIYIDGQDSYRNWSGTSFSSPEVAAAAAMVKSIEPEVNQDGFMKLIQDTSVDKGVEGFDQYYGWGLVDFGTMAEEVLKDKRLPFYNIDFNIADETGTAVDKADIVVKAAEDISWENDSDEGIEAGTLEKGEAVYPEIDGRYKLHKGEYEYSISKDGYYNTEGVFSTYTENQTVKVTLEQAFHLDIEVLDFENDSIDDATIELSRTSGNIKETMTQNVEGKYSAELPAASYIYTVRADGYEESTGIITVLRESTKVSIPIYVRGEICETDFEFTDSATGNEINDVSVTVMDNLGETVLPSEDGKYKLVKGKKYSYTGSKIGYEDILNKVSIGNQLSDTIKEEMDQVRFTIDIKARTKSGNELNDVFVTVKDSNGVTYKSSKADSSKFNLDKGDYTYTVSKSGYGDEKGTFKIDSASRNIKVIMSEVKYKVSFDITDDNDVVIDDASLTVIDGNGDSAARYADRSFMLENGTYKYHVYKEGFSVRSGELTVKDEAFKLTVSLEPGDSGSQPAEFEGGSGTKGDPYLISNENQLKALSKRTEIIYGGNSGADSNVTKETTGYYRLIDDIHLTSSWTPVGSYENSHNYNIFAGHFDGAGYSIDGISVDTSKAYAGLFGAVRGGEIKNVCVTGSIKGGNYTGGIVGCVFYSSLEQTLIENCSNSATVQGTACVGGIVGSFTGDSSAKVNGYVNSCSNDGNVKAATGSLTYTSSNNNAGGIIGEMNAVKVTSCYNLGNVDAGYNVGGITGSSSKNTYLNNSFNTGTITQKLSDTNYVGRRGGIAGIASGNIDKSYYLRNSASAGVGISSGDEAKNYERKNEADMKNNQVFVDTLNLQNDINYGNYTISESYPLLMWQNMSEKVYASKPKITVQPEGNSGMPYKLGDNPQPITATVTVPGITSDSELTYQWYENDTNSRKNATKIEGAEGVVPASGVIEYIPELDEPGIMYYHVVVTNTLSLATGETATNREISDMADITIEKNISATSPVISRIGIGETTDKETSVQKDSHGSISVYATVNDGGELSYQWYKSRYPNTKGSPIKGATSKSCDFDTSEKGTSYYYVKITNTVKDDKFGSIDKLSVNSQRIKIEVLPYSIADQKTADKVIELIKSLGAVTLDSKDDINKAREAYEALSGIQKSLIAPDVLDRLVKAEYDYNVLKKESEKKGNEKKKDGVVLGDTSVPKKAAPKSFKAKALKTKVKLTWKKKSGITKYQVAYKQKSAKKWKYKTISAKKKTITIKKLKPKKKYKFKIRSYKLIKDKKVYSKWSKTRTVKIK